MGKDVLLCAKCALDLAGKMTRDESDRACGSCTKRFTTFRFKEGEGGGVRNTAICWDCANTWKLCQACMDDLGAGGGAVSTSQVPKEEEKSKVELKAKPALALTLPSSSRSNRPTPYPTKRPSNSQPKGSSSSSTPSADLSPPEDTSITTLKVLGIGASLAKTELTRHFIRYGEVTQVSLRGGTAFLKFRRRREAEEAVWKSRAGIEIEGRSLTVEWDREGGKGKVVIPPVEELPEFLHGTEVPASAFSKSLGRGTYDPQLRQLGHFMDTNQLVQKGKGSEGKGEGGRRK